MANIFVRFVRSEYNRISEELGPFSFVQLVNENIIDQDQNIIGFINDNGYWQRNIPLDFEHLDEQYEYSDVVIFNK